MGTNKKFCCNDLLAPRYKLQPVMDSIYIAEGQNLKFGSVVDCKGFLCDSTHLEPYAILYEDCDTTNGAQEANVLIMGEFNIEKLVFGADATGDVLDKIVFYAKKNGIIIRPYDYAPSFTPTEVSSIENVIPEGTSQTNPLMNAEETQSKIDASIHEVTLDPSAVALGNVHLLDEVTSFAADAKILVDSETNGPGAMPGETLLDIVNEKTIGSLKYQKTLPFGRSFIRNESSRLDVEDTTWWSATTNNVTKTADTTDFVKYGESLKLSLETASVEGILTKNGSFDFLNNIFEFWIKTDNTANVSDIVIFLSAGNTSFSKYARFDISALFTGGKWDKRHVTKLDWSLYGGMVLDDLKDIKAFRFRFRTTANGNGNIWLNGAILSPQKYNKGGLVILFDDAKTCILENAFPVLSKNGFQATTYVVTSYCENESAGYMTKDQLRILADDGWVVGSHTKNHDHLQTLTDEQLDATLKDSHDWLVANGFKNGSKHLAYPFGEFDTRVMAAARKYYQTSYSTKQFYNAEFASKNMALTRFMWTQADRNVDYVKNKIKAAFDNGIIVSWYLHDISSGAGADWSKSDFETIINYVASIGCPVLTIEDLSRTFDMEQID